MQHKSKNTKSNFLAASLRGMLAVLLLVFVTSCDTETKTTDTKEVAEDKNEAKFENSKENDAAFLVSAAEINLEEIELGKLAQTKGSMAEVKAMGKMMVTEHTKALAELQALAASKQISLPTSLTENNRDAYKDLNEKKAKDFDKDYCDMMVKGHKDAIDKFEDAATSANDADVKAWAAGMVPGLKAHLQQAETCQKNCEKMNNNK